MLEKTVRVGEVDVSFVRQLQYQDYTELNLREIFSRTCQN